MARQAWRTWAGWRPLAAGLVGLLVVAAGLWFADPSWLAGVFWGAAALIFGLSGLGPPRHLRMAAAWAGALAPLLAAAGPAGLAPAAMAWGVAAFAGAPPVALAGWGLLAGLAHPWAGFAPTPMEWALLATVLVLALGALVLARMEWRDRVRRDDLLRRRARHERLVLDDRISDGVRQLTPRTVQRRALEREQALIRRLEDIVRTVRRALGAHGAYLYLIDEGNRLALTVYDGIDRDVELVRLLEPGPRAGLIGWVFHQESAFSSHEYARAISGQTHLPEPRDIRSFLGVPVVDQYCIGVLAVDSFEIQAFVHEEHRQILEMMAGQVVHWLHYDREKLQTEEELAHWRAFFQVAHELQAVSAPEAVHDYLLDLIDLVVPVDFVALIEGEGEDMQVAAVRGDCDAAPAAGTRFPAADGWVGWALAQDGVRSVADLSRRRISLPVLYAGDGVPMEGSLLCVPLRASEATEHDVGMLLWAREPAAFDVGVPELLSRLLAPFELALQRARAMDSLERLATTDGLTGLTNRRVAMERLEEAVRRTGRSGQPVSAVLLDVDHFKQVNDNHGHAVGDDVLREVAAALAAVVRDVDLAARYGGEEFLLILPDTALDGAVRVAERARTAIARLRVPLPGVRRALRVTASFGVAALEAGSVEPVDQLLQRADEALYAAKERGRDRVCVSRLEQDDVA